MLQHQLQLSVAHLLYYAATSARVDVAGEYLGKNMQEGLDVRRPKLRRVHASLSNSKSDTCADTPKSNASQPSGAYIVVGRSDGVMHVAVPTNLTLDSCEAPLASVGDRQVDRQQLLAVLVSAGAQAGRQLPQLPASSASCTPIDTS